MRAPQACQNVLKLTSICDKQVRFRLEAELMLAYERVHQGAYVQPVLRNTTYEQMRDLTAPFAAAA